MPSAIEFENLTKSYGSTVGIQDLNAAVEQGEVFGFLGTNGAGKSTTIRSMVGLLRPTSGAVRVLGLDPIADHKALAAKIGYLPGELRLYGRLSGKQHLELLGDLQGAPTPKRGELCERLGLRDSDLQRAVETYSRGMKQKIGLVQALQHDPTVIVLDEPTEGLDPLVQETFFELIAEAKAAGRTVFLSSHVLPEVQRICERVAIVRAGKLVAVEEIAALRDAAARTVTLKFADGFDQNSLVLEETWKARWDGSELTLAIQADDVVGALRTLLTNAVIDVTVEEADLDEAFLAFYRGES